MKILEVNSQPNTTLANRSQTNKGVYAQNCGVIQDSCSFTSKKKDGSFLQKNWGKLLLGTGVIVLGAVLTKGKLWGKAKPVTFEKVQQNLAEIFGKKNISKDETEQLVKQYQDLLKIEDKNEFITKAFNQIKKDFGYEKTSYKVNTMDKPIKDKNRNMNTLAYQGTDSMNVYKDRSKPELLDAIVHEFTHLKQLEYEFRTSPDKIFKIRFDNLMDGLKNQPEVKKIHDKNVKEFERLLAQELKKELKPLESYFGHLPKFKSGSPEYLQGEKYLESRKESYRMATDKSSYKAYRDNLIEQEAWQRGSLMQEVVRYISAMK